MENRGFTSPMVNSRTPFYHDAVLSGQAPDNANCFLRRCRSAGLQICCLADFQSAGLSIFSARRISAAPMRESRETADFEVCYFVEAHAAPKSYRHSLAKASRVGVRLVEGLLLALANLWLIFSGMGLTEYKRKRDFKKT